ncbi:acetylornithine deacetylase/succinyl-diaminopimelate desuccinylase-like protein [Erythromicrobium ramosum]|uniref:Acetylornithine deacetylase/succinyl-diaminopimelate desuccinylase-like protein n=1 Tax=Erythrobacter ramosus TaxID=35811 RepID=A0A6I4UK52_9SPHN|nr:M20/M25/M40 family metallo-hydrolase [Erythrobacter ramosus]MBB3776077.1 acetylornithine deacetylase/succinyl-diaminopimelate desuccinylase-like protein [Erythrobacter ramosus]MXP38836.1 M20/M25/M40 family metallo-hydrolase [Erythrobacter ramosus]
MKRLTGMTMAAVIALAVAPLAAETPNREELVTAVEAQQGTTVKALQDWVALPTIAAEKRGTPEGAEYMRKLALDAGFQQAKIIPTDGVPAVFATLDSGAKTTVGIYFMYDVKQFDPAEWSSPPLDAKLVERPGEGTAIVGRGVVNQKGPQMAFLAAIKAIQASGRKLPVNLVLVAEGEEEVASTHFDQVVAVPEVQAALSTAVGVFIPSANQNRDGSAGITLGAKGAVEFQLVVGGETSDKYPKTDIHSSNHARIESPAWRLVKALDTLVADDGHTPAIDGWFENVQPLTARQKELIAQSVKPDAEAGEKTLLGVGRWINDEDYVTSLERFFSQPTVNIQGLVAGYTGEGGKTVLPGRAEAKLEFRLVPNMTKDEAVTKLRAHLAKRGFDDVQVTVSGGYGPNETEEDSILIRAQKRMFDDSGVPYTIRPRNAGSWPGVVFNGPPLNLPASQFGLGRGGGAHAPNEWFLIESTNPKVYGLDEVTMAYVDYLYALAEEAER